MDIIKMYLVSSTDKKAIINIKIPKEKNVLLFSPLYDQCNMIESILITVSKGKHKELYKPIMKQFYMMGTMFYFNDVLVDYTNITVVGVQDGDYIFVDMEKWGDHYEQSRSKIL